MFEQTFKNIDDILRKEAGCASELDYTEQTSWLLFLKYLDDLEASRATEAELRGAPYTPIIDAAHRWSRWAAPKDATGKLDHNRALTGPDLIDYVNRELFPYLQGFGNKIYDGAAGSCGFLCESFDYLLPQAKTTGDREIIQTRTFYAKEKKSLAYVIGTMNMILHGIDAPNIVHTNTLAEQVLDIQEKDRFDVILANPPFGGKERPEIQQNFPIKTGETAYLFLQHFIKSLRAGGAAAVVIKNTFLSNTDNASVALRRELLESCKLHTILDMPGGTFQGAGVKTVVLFFEKGEATRRIWYFNGTSNDWGVFTIGETCTLRSGTTVKANLERSSGEIPYLKVADMSHPANLDGVTTSSRFLLRSDVGRNAIIPMGATIFPKRGGAIMTNKKRLSVLPKPRSCTTANWSRTCAERRPKDNDASAL